MKLAEIADPRVQLEMAGYIAVPKGTLWQRNLHNVWVFDTYEAAKKASHSEQGLKVLDATSGHYLLPMQSLNFVPLLLQLDTEGLGGISVPDFHVYAFSISEKSCRAAAEKAMPPGKPVPLWCYRTWNSDAAYFDEEEE